MFSLKILVVEDKRLLTIAVDTLSKLSGPWGVSEVETRGQKTGIVGQGHDI